jgi:hypothetical protein
MVPIMDINDWFLLYGGCIGGGLMNGKFKDALSGFIGVIPYQYCLVSPSCTIYPNGF